MTNQNSAPPDDWIVVWVLFAGLATLIILTLITVMAVTEPHTLYSESMEKMLFNTQE